MTKPFELDVISDEKVGEGGFLHLRRLRLRNLRSDGAHTGEWVCDFVERKKGLDAVVVALYRLRAPAATADPTSAPTWEVLLRDGLRPALIFGRDPARLPLPDARRYFFFTEVVAGIVEEGEVGERALRHRAVDEAWEEAGVRLDPKEVELLGSSFPSPGLTAEKFWFVAARVPVAEAVPAEGDGSPMEEGSSTRWVEIDEAIAMAERAELEDAKSELIIRRLRDRLRASGPSGKPDSRL